MNGRDLVAWNLRSLRVKRGLSQEQLAVDARVDRTYVGALERGQVNPTLEIVDRLAGALEVHTSRLFVEPLPGARRPRPLKGGRRPASRRPS